MTESYGDVRQVEIRVYGRLRRCLPDEVRASGRPLHVKIEADETLGSLLERLGIERQALYTVFVNGRLLATRNRMAPWLAYRQVQADVWCWDTEIDLRPGDRIGLFGEDMALLVV